MDLSLEEIIDEEFIGSKPRVPEKWKKYKCIFNCISLFIPNQLLHWLIQEKPKSD